MCWSYTSDAISDGVIEVRKVTLKTEETIIKKDDVKWRKITINDVK